MFGNFFNKFIPCGRIKRLGRSDLPECRADAPFLFDDVYKNGTRGEKKQADVRQYGRSMVEMLGVLAIIGVLSVGGIAGYNKAIFKHRLNHQSEQITQIMSALIEHKSVFISFAPNESLIPFFIKLNAIPPKMIIQNNTTYISDVFGITVNLIRSASKQNMYFTFNISKKSDENHDICRNIIESFKGYEDELVALGINSTTADNINQQSWYYGKQTSINYKPKIHTLDLETIQNLCEICDKNSCGIYAIL